MVALLLTLEAALSFILIFFLPPSCLPWCCVTYLYFVQARLQTVDDVLNVAEQELENAESGKRNLEVRSAAWVF